MFHASQKYIVPAKSYIASSCLNSKTKTKEIKERKGWRRDRRKKKVNFPFYFTEKQWQTGRQSWRSAGRASARRAQLSPALPQLGRCRPAASFFLLSVSHLCIEGLQSPLWCINFVIPGQGIEMERGYDKLEPPLLADAQPRLCCAVLEASLQQSPSLKLRVNPGAVSKLLIFSF